MKRKNITLFALFMYFGVWNYAAPAVSPLQTNLGKLKTSLTSLKGKLGTLNTKLGMLKGKLSQENLGNIEDLGTYVLSSDPDCSVKVSRNKDNQLGGDLIYSTKKIATITYEKEPKKFWPKYTFEATLNFIIDIPRFANYWGNEVHFHAYTDLEKASVKKDLNDVGVSTIGLFVTKSNGYINVDCYTGEAIRQIVEQSPEWNNAFPNKRKLNENIKNLQKKPYQQKGVLYRPTPVSSYNDPDQSLLPDEVEFAIKAFIEVLQPINRGEASKLTEITKPEEKTPFGVKLKPVVVEAKLAKPVIEKNIVINNKTYCKCEFWKLSGLDASVKNKPAVGNVPAFNVISNSNLDVTTFMKDSANNGAVFQIAANNKLPWTWTSGGLQAGAVVEATELGNFIRHDGGANSFTQFFTDNDLPASLGTKADLAEDKNKIFIAIHSGLSVQGVPGQVVHVPFVAAYNGSSPIETVKNCLDVAYEGTLLAAVRIGVPKVFLTLMGVGEFCNPMNEVIASIDRAVTKYVKKYGLDVTVLYRGNDIDVIQKLQVIEANIK